MMQIGFLSKDIRDLSLVPKTVNEDPEAELLHTDEVHESISRKISDFKKKKTKIVSCFYCEPSRNRSQYLEHVETVLDENGAGMHIICGDLNIDLVNEYLSARIILETLMTAQGLGLISLREPIRETASSSTCIVPVYSNIPLQLTRNENTTFSDQYSLQLSFKICYEIAENIFDS